MRRIPFLLAAALAALFAIPTAAQVGDSANAAVWLRGVCPGREVLIATTSGERVRGYCAPIEDTRLRVRWGADEQTVEFTAVDSIWVRSRGASRGATTGALVGAVLVGGAGVLLGSGLCGLDDGECREDTLLLAMGGAATGGLVGAILGGAAGHATRAWARIYPW